MTAQGNGQQFGGSTQNAYGADANFDGQAQYYNSFKEMERGNSYKNPWTTISRPMNGFVDINEGEYEAGELRKAQLATDLKK